MPGMMDTILNLGLNDKTVLALAKKHRTLDLQKIVIEDLYKCTAQCSSWNRKLSISRN